MSIVFDGVWLQSVVVNVPLEQFQQSLLRLLAFLFTLPHFTDERDSGYIKRGESNKLLFDPNCVVVFNEIKKLKVEGKTVKEITSFFKEDALVDKRKNIVL